MELSLLAVNSWGDVGLPQRCAIGEYSAKGWWRGESRAGRELSLEKIYFTKYYERCCCAVIQIQNLKYHPSLNFLNS